MKLCNVAKHGMTLGETSNHTIERWEQERYFSCRTRFTGKRCNQPGEGLFQFMMEIDQLAADFHRLDDKSVTKLRNYVIIVAGLSANYETEVRMLENNPTGLEKAEVERVVGN